MTEVVFYVCLFVAMGANCVAMFFNLKAMRGWQRAQELAEREFQIWKEANAHETT